MNPLGWGGIGGSSVAAKAAKARLAHPDAMPPKQPHLSARQTYTRMCILYIYTIYIYI